MNKQTQNLFRKLLLLCVAQGTLGLLNAQQYSKKYVETSTTVIQGETYSMVKMSRKDDHVKAKYFAAKDYNGTSVYQRYQEWARNKNIVAVSSGTYMTYCESSIAKPVGLCIDRGTLVNNTLVDNLDGLAIVYATGGIAVSNLKDGDLTVTTTDNKKKTLDLKNAFQRAEFIKWAAENEATVFQTHLFCYKNELKVYSNGSTDKRERRFLAVCKDDSGVVYHYIVNLSGWNTIYDASVKVTKFLKDTEEMGNIVFLINLDTGCQNVFEVKKPDGSTDTREAFKADKDLSQAVNLLVYYYE